MPGANSKTILFVFLIAVVMIGCGKRAIIRQYYVIDFPVLSDSTQLAQPPLSDKICEVLPVRVSPAYAEKQIALRTDSHELKYYVYHFWAVKPENAFANLIENYLQSKRLFTLISSQLWKTHPDYEISTRIYHLEAVKVNKHLNAHLHLDIELTDTRNHQTVVVHSFDKYAPLPKRKVNLFAAVISQMLHRELDVFSQKIRAYLLSLPKMEK